MPKNNLKQWRNNQSSDHGGRLPASYLKKIFVDSSKNIGQDAGSIHWCE